MDNPIPRRDALRRLALFSLSALVPAGTVGCSKKTTCLDVSGLAPEDVTTRNNIAGYVDVAPDPTKKCELCAHFLPAGKEACGGCKVVKGPINPNGTCKLFVTKPA